VESNLEKINFWSSIHLVLILLVGLLQVREYILDIRPPPFST
jgi:hypothetical protein